MKAFEIAEIDKVECENHIKAMRDYDYYREEGSYYKDKGQVNQAAEALLKAFETQDIINKYASSIHPIMIELAKFNDLENYNPRNN